MNTIKNGILMTWIAVNIIVFVNSANLFSGSVEFIAGHFTGFAIITAGGAFAINYVGNKIIAKRKEKIPKSL